MGTTLHQIVFDVGSGIPDGKNFKAVQIGGPSGGCLPESALDLPVDYDSLREAGAMMGSGGMVMLDEDDCMVEIARYFLEFTQKESCGKCTFCRLGTKQMLEVLTDIVLGQGKMEDLETLSRAQSFRIVDVLWQEMVALTQLGQGKGVQYEFQLYENRLTIGELELDPYLTYHPQVGLVSQAANFRETHGEFDSVAILDTNGYILGIDPPLETEAFLHVLKQAVELSMGQGRVTDKKNPK